MDRQLDAEELIAAGRHSEAAGILRRMGELERAQKLYEKIWDFRSAAEVARERGDRPALLRLLIEARDFVEARQMLDEFERASTASQRHAAEIYERARLYTEAAGLRERLGEKAAAHQLYLKAGLPLEAARLDELAGHLREAGLLYEQFLLKEPSSPEAPRVHLQLAKLLGGLGQHEEAVRHLQCARAQAGPLTANCEEALAIELWRLGYTDAAEAAFLRLKQVNPAASASLSTLLSSVPPETERLAGRYEVVRLLGSGGMGRVYEARDLLTGQTVALKLFASPVESRAEECYARFIREVRLLEAMRHERVVRIYGFEETLRLLAMEYMDGGTLADRLITPLPPSQVRAILLSVLSGLEVVHTHGVIHRDIKPANIFFTRSGEAKLGDFGVAHLQAFGPTQTAGFIGTLSYMSPEQVSGAPIDAAADQYALGVTAFQALTGRLPFLGPDFASQHLAEPAPRPSSLRPGLDPKWDLLIARLLEKDPQARFENLDELRHALRAISSATADRLPHSDFKQAGLLSNEPSSDATASSLTSRFSSSSWAGATAVSRIERAIDRRLGREVVIEHFAPDYFDGAEGKAHLDWLKAMARGGPALQRLLAFDRTPEGVLAIFDAPTGAVVTALGPRDRDRLHRALQPIHTLGLAHGQIADSLVAEEYGVTLLVCGRAPLRRTPADDLEDLTRLSDAVGRD